MRKTVPWKKPAPISFFTVFALIALLSAGPASFGSGKPAGEKETYQTVLVNKSQNNRKHKIRLYTDAGHTAVLYSVNGVSGKKYQLYVFDMDSRLVTQAGVCNHETTALNNMSRGSYLFAVFLGDEEVESGEFSVR
jgi:hypothetical protein